MPAPKPRTPAFSRSRIVVIPIERSGNKGGRRGAGSIRTRSGLGYANARTELRNKLNKLSAVNNYFAEHKKLPAISETKKTFPYLEKHLTGREL